MKGPHKYPGVSAKGEFMFTSDCANGCGCWMGGYRSGGPDGVNPFGECPKAPLTEPPQPDELTLACMSIDTLKAQVSNLEIEKAQLTKVNGELREKLAKFQRLIHADLGRDEGPHIGIDPVDPGYHQGFNGHGY
jgi:hypothetical protein